MDIHIVERHTGFCREMGFNAKYFVSVQYENRLAEDEWRCIVILDAAWVYLYHKKIGDYSFTKCIIKSQKTW